MKCSNLGKTATQQAEAEGWPGRAGQQNWSRLRKILKLSFWPPHMCVHTPIHRTQPNTLHTQQYIPHIHANKSHTETIHTHTSTQHRTPHTLTRTYTHQSHTHIQYIKHTPAICHTLQYITHPQYITHTNLIHISNTSNIHPQYVTHCNILHTPNISHTCTHTCTHAHTHTHTKRRCAWWHTPVTLALGWWRQKDQDFSHLWLHGRFKARLSYTRTYF